VELTIRVHGLVEVAARKTWRKRVRRFFSNPDELAENFFCFGFLCLCDRKLSVRFTFPELTGRRVFRSTESDRFSVSVVDETIHRRDRSFRFRKLQLCLFTSAKLAPFLDELVALEYIERLRLIPASNALCLFSLPIPSVVVWIFTHSLSQLSTRTISLTCLLGHTHTLSHTYKRTHALLRAPSKSANYCSSGVSLRRLFLRSWLDINRPLVAINCARYFFVLFVFLCLELQLKSREGSEALLNSKHPFSFVSIFS